MANGPNAPDLGRWHSLRWRLPLTISIVVTAILAVILFAAYREVKSALLVSGSQRVRAAAGQVASLLEASLRGSTTQVRSVASNPAFRDYLKTRRPELLAEVNADLQKLLTGASPRSLTLWDERGARLAEVSKPAPTESPGPAELPSSTVPAAEGLQPLRPADEGAYMEAVAIVSDLDPTHARLGYVDIRSGFAVNPPGLFSKLVGDNATVLLGNRDGSLWVDLADSHRVDGPTLSAGNPDGMWHRDGIARVGAMSDIRDTPFEVLVDFPETVMLAPARRFLERMIGFGLIAALASVVLMRALTTRVTRPLAELTAATEAVAAGDYSRHVGHFRRDELGRLARAFDAMTTRVSADIAERELSARTLRENEERLRFTLSTARVGTWRLHIDSGFVEWSETMGELFGLKADQRPTRIEDAHALVHPEDREGAAAAAARAPDDEREHEVQFRATQPDGSYRWLVARSRQVTESGARRLVGVCIDVTEQKMLAEQLRQSQKMEAIGKLAGGVAHDFNNLLTAILGFGNMLLEDFAPDDPRRPQMESIIKAGTRAADLTAQLLAFSRRQLLQLVVVDVKAAVEESSVLLRRLIGENIQLQTVLTQDTAKVRADQVQLQQILMNLAINARDAMPEGGRLTIEVTNLELDATYGNQHFAVQPGPYVMIAVTDTGVGMSEAVRARLFEPFFTTKRRGEGTGLGLATVYGAVKQAGGYIWVYSDPGRGSTFKVYLPRIAGDTPVAEHAPPAEAKAAVSETILLVEDEDAVRLLAGLLLERAGYRVLVAANAEEAGQMHLEHSGVISLLMTDVVLPGSSGPELFQRLSMRDPRLKVVYMSGYTDDAVFRTGRLQPGVAFVQKPFRKQELLQKIREVLDS